MTAFGVVILVLASRRARIWLMAAMFMGGVGVAVGDREVLLQIRSGAPYPVLLLEVVGALGGATVPALAAPRLRSWESGRVRVALPVLAGLVSVALVALPVGIVRLCGLAAGLSTPRLSGALVTTALVAGVSGLVAVLFGPRPGPVSAIALFGAVTVLRSLAREDAQAAWSDDLTRAAAVVLCVCYVGASARRLGRRDPLTPRRRRRAARACGRRPGP